MRKNMNLTIFIVIVLGLIGNISAQAAEENMLSMSAEHLPNWSFVHGPWSQTDDGIITAPHASVDNALAFYTAKAYQNFDAEFDFRWDTVICGAGLVFRAQDARHYYLVHFPCTGQQYRKAHFWAAISKVDETGFVQVLKMAQVPGVPSEIGLWHHARVKVEGDEIRLWVDGRPFPVVHDNTYKNPGAIGLESYSGVGKASGSSFKNLRIKGKALKPKPWNKTLKPQQNWFYPCPENTYGVVQNWPNITRAPNGELLMRFWVGEKSFHGPEGFFVVTRSADNGRTWSEPEKGGDELSGIYHTTGDGRLLLVKIQAAEPHEILITESKDNGKSWPKPQGRGKIVFPQDFDEVYLTKTLELKDGTLLLFMYAINKPPQGCENALTDLSYLVRSTDGGRSFSPPMLIDGPNPKPQYVMIKRVGSEVSATETRNGNIIAFVRSPNPTMWECWSYDKGLTWKPAARGPFAMYACHTSMQTTGSGELLIAGRHPGIAIQLSRDDAMTWQCYRIDTPFYANGCMYMVSPNVALYAYSGKYCDPRIRAQLIEITADGLKPIRQNREPDTK